MRAVRLAGFEFRRQRTGLQRLAIGFLLVVPLLYGALYLWSNWDPYGKTGQMPVAVVNEDHPVQVSGTTVDAGGLFVQALKADRIFDWHFTDATDAREGLKTGRYQIVIRVPAAFSADLASGSTTTPRRAVMTMNVDDGNGYLIEIIARTAKDEITQKVDQAATTAYFESVYGQLEQLRNGLAQARDGAVQLRDGLARETTGARQLASGLDTANTASGELARGAQQVADGNRQLASVLVPAANQLAAALPGLSKQVTAVTGSAATLSSQVNQGAQSLAARQQTVADAIAELGRQQPGITSTAAYQQLLSASQQLTARVDQVSASTAAVNDGAQRLAQAGTALGAQVPALRSQLTGGAAKIQALADGAQRVATGAGQLHSGLLTADTGAHQLADGADQLHTGAAQLETGLDSAVNRLPDLSDGQKKANAQILGSPADVNLAVAHPAKVYGRGLAPFFFSIALWVFGIAAFLVLRPITGRMLAGRTGNLTAAVAGWLPVMTVGTVGGLILLAAVQVGLGLDPVHPLWTVGLIVLASAAFTGIAHLLRVAAGVVGSAVALVLLMLQLTSSAGIYPAQTLPAFFAALHPYLPMTYLVDGLRITLTGGYGPHLVRDLAVIAGYGAAALLGTTLAISRQRVWTIRRLHPVLEG
ncbi:MAG TPA: YhgE/Pip domain-containing protein [Kineosporiaceae bacterium]|nr:YhgE/Pip domain-containing protein [Kineosporiaceae bacterium]